MTQKKALLGFLPLALSYTFSQQDSLSPFSAPVAGPDTGEAEVNDVVSTLKALRASDYNTFRAVRMLW